MGKSSNFSQRLTAEINRQLGPDAAAITSPEQLIKQFSLGVSRETLRLILREGYEPRKRLQEKLLEQVRQYEGVTTAEHYLDRSGTRDEILELLEGQVGIEIPAGRGDLRPCDLLMEPLGLGLNPVLLRCLDDAGEARLVHSSYFEPVISQMKRSMDSFGIREAVLISHRFPSPDAKTGALRHGIKLVEYSEFVASRLRLRQIAAFFAEKRRERGILDDIFEPLPALHVSEFDSVIVESLATLREFLRPDGNAVAAILGSFGTGKTSLLLTLAHELARQFEKSPDNWIIPLWVNASAITPPDTDKAILGALNIQTAGPSLPITTVKRLIRAGRIWLFIDGLDESVQLRGAEAVVTLVKSLAELCTPHGRLILSGRQEMFDNIKQERDLFDQAPAEVGVLRRLILRMQAMPQDTVYKVLRSRLGAQGWSLAEEIRKSKALSDLASRPIFMHIIAETADQFNGGAIGQERVTSLFNFYVRKWVAEENNRTKLLPIREEERLRTCEMLALMHDQYGGRQNGFSLADLEVFIRSEIDPVLRIRDLPAFLAEARVAMFLERREDDRFDFAHHSLREFFEARRLSRDIQERKFNSLGSTPLRRSNFLLRFFICEMLQASDLDVVGSLDRLINETLDWEGTQDPLSLRERSIPGPPFGVGPFCHFLPNLISLRLEADTMSASPSPLDLRGAHLPMVNLSSVLGHSDTRVILDFANLEHAHGERQRPEKARCKGAIPPDKFSSREEVDSYCRKFDLYDPCRFSSSSRDDDFVLIPGGDYTLQGYDRKKERETVEVVSVPAFLIQRRPVTNAEFARFIEQFPDWAPDEVRTRSKNDYYLSYWYKYEKEPAEWADRPVVQVNWYAARAYAAASGLRLPTEVEWEIATRIAQDGLQLRPWGDSLEWNNEPCVFRETLSQSDSDETPMFPVRSVFDLPPGFKDWERSLSHPVPHHLLGLIREWVQDHWCLDYPSVTSRLLPVNLGFEKDDDGRWGPAKEIIEDRVIRGAGFTSPEEHISCSYRAPHRPSNVNPDVGFRCVRPIRVSRSKLSQL